MLEQFSNLAAWQYLLITLLILNVFFNVFSNKDKILVGHLRIFVVSSITGFLIGEITQVGISHNAIVLSISIIVVVIIFVENCIKIARLINKQ